MALWARHTTTATGSPTVNTQTFNGQFSQITVINRSTTAMYFTSLATQGTSADGVPTIGGNHTYYLAPGTAVDTPNMWSAKTIFDAVGGSQSAGTDYVTISIVCASTMFAMPKACTPVRRPDGPTPTLLAGQAIRLWIYRVSSPAMYEAKPFTALPVPVP